MTVWIPNILEKYAAISDDPTADIDQNENDGDTPSRQLSWHKTSRISTATTAVCVIFLSVTQQCTVDSTTYLIIVGTWHHWQQNSVCVSVSL